MRGPFAGNGTMADEETLRPCQATAPLQMSDEALLWSALRSRRLDGLQFRRGLIANCIVAAGERPLIRPFGAPSPRWRGEKGVRRAARAQRKFKGPDPYAVGSRVQCPMPVASELTGGGFL
jgi:hypothetical protein